MTIGHGQPPKLEGVMVLPPMEQVNAKPSGAPVRGGSKRKLNHGKTRKRFALLNAFVDFAAGELTRSEILVWMILYRDTRDDIAATSQLDLARRAGTTDRSVRRAIKRLEERGLLKTIYRGGLNRGTSKYRVCCEMKENKRRTPASA